MAKENPALSTTKVAIVTGGSRGLGCNTVINLAKRGVNSIFTYNSNRAEADKVVAAVSDVGAKAAALQLDTGKVTTFDAFVQSVREALATLGAERFNYLVNNAGTSRTRRFTRQRRRSWTSSMTSTSRACSS